MQRDSLGRSYGGLDLNLVRIGDPEQRGLRLNECAKGHADGGHLARNRAGSLHPPSVSRDIRGGGSSLRTPGLRGGGSGLSLSPFVIDARGDLLVVEETLARQVPLREGFLRTRRIPIGGDLCCVPAFDDS